MGASLQQGSTGVNMARQAVLRAGFPTSVPAMSIDRQCSSGLMTIAVAAREILVDGLQIAVGGGMESISLVQNEHQNSYRGRSLVDGASARHLHGDGANRRNCLFPL